MSLEFIMNGIAARASQRGGEEAVHMSVMLRTAPAAAALSLAVLMLTAMNPAVAAPCDKIVPVTPTIEVFETSTAAAPLHQVEGATLPKEICRLGRENGRYRIKLGSVELWVGSAQFAGVSLRARPLRERMEKTPAGVRLSRRHSDSTFKKTAAGKSSTKRAKRGVN